MITQYLKELGRMSSQKQKCWFYETFGDCKFGRKCSRSHKVWPYRTQRTVATIVTEIVQLPGVIEFVSESDERTSQTQQYYISKGQWFSAGATSGDIVEIIISEKRNENGCCFARICKIVQSISTARIPSLMSAAFIEQNDCIDFETYRDCKWGERCFRTHDIRASYNQSFHLAKVHSVSSFGAGGLKVLVEIKASHDPTGQSVGKIQLYVPDKYSCNVREGNLVIVQTSSRTYNRSEMRLGKIVTVLHESLEIWQNEMPLEVNLKSAFTFIEPLAEPDGSFQRKIIIAYSMERCLEHDRCERIGVHARAAALGAHSKLEHFFVPFHRANIRSQAKGFKVDSIRFALTMYAHSASNCVDGPFLTPVSIQPDCLFTFGDGEPGTPKYQQYLERLWPLFGVKTFIEGAVNSLSRSYLVDIPDTWKERFLVRQMIHFFNDELTKYLRSKGGKFVLVRKFSPGKSTIAKRVVISSEKFDRIKSSWQSADSVEEKKILLGFLLDSAKISEEDFCSERLCDKYTWEVVSCGDLQDNQSVITTSPIRETADFLNQQTVLSLMSMSTVSLYSKDELLGTTVRRYHTPTILTAEVRQLTKTVLHLQLSGIFGRKRGNRQVWLDQIFKCPVLSLKSSSLHKFDDEDSDAEPIDGISLIAENVFSEEYCNSSLVDFSTEQITVLAATTIQQNVEADKAPVSIDNLISTFEKYDAPYQLHEKGTLVTLSRGVELQLQVALKEGDDEGGHWLRLLKVGKDCHLCLVHINSPRAAFISKRSDTSDLITQNTLSLMKDKIASNSLKSIVLLDIAIEWNDYYFSGGTFTTFTNIKPRNLLCIRREIDATESRSAFVWTCHAVVSKVSDSLVMFIVCSLFQDQTPDMWTETDNGRFIVEVIDLDGNEGTQS